MPRTCAEDPSSCEDRLQKLGESVPGLICSFRLRPDGTACMPFTTPAAEDLYGISQQALAEDVAPLFANIHPDDVRRVMDTVAAAARAVSRWHDEFRYLHPTKGLRWLEGWSAPSREPDGSIIWHGLVMDVTERKRAEEALRASEIKYRTLYEGTPVMMHSIDAQGRLVSVSERWLETLGYTRSEVIGRRSVEFLTPESRRYAEETVLPAYFATGVCSEVPYQFVKKNGEIIDVLLSAIAERDAGGKFVRSLAVLVDVTARKRAEEALREADRRKDRFLGILSHELRNPLAPIRNALYLLERAPPQGEQAGRARAVIARQIDHLTRLVDDLLDVTRISSGKVTLQRRRVDLHELVLRTVEDHKGMFTDRQIDLDVGGTAEPLPIHADPTRIAQVVGNLLQNSAKFTDRGGRVTVSVERNGALASVRVQDSGIGVAPEMMGRLFEPFTQADESLQRPAGGLGLGLALVKGLVELHGGSVEARSEGLGRGTEIAFRLPIEVGAADAARVSPAGPARSPRRRVLVIEDNLDAAETLREMLQLWHHEVQVAHDGRQGVERARAFRPEVILCDIGLPEMDGYAVARAIRADPALARTALVALTGYALPEDQRQAAEAGFDLHIAKPVSVDRIESVLATAAGRG